MRIIFSLISVKVIIEFNLRMFSANLGKDCRSSFRHHSMFWESSGRLSRALTVLRLFKSSVSCSIRSHVNKSHARKYLNPKGNCLNQQSTRCYLAGAWFESSCISKNAAQLSNYCHSMLLAKDLELKCLLTENCFSDTESNPVLMRGKGG